MKHPSDIFNCPLIHKEIAWGGAGGCFEIQEVRTDNMDAEFLPFEIDVNNANEICDKCKWYLADND